MKVIRIRMKVIRIRMKVIRIRMKVIRIRMKVIRILMNGCSLVEYDRVVCVSVLLPAHGVIRIRMKPDPDPQERLLTCTV
jgi:hypothetical protein